jgi:transcriptional regulator with XRE-family HTH domain
MNTPLHALRIKHNLTQVQLAERCYTRQGMISIWERMVSPPSLPHQANLARAFGMTLQELQEHCGWPISPSPGRVKTSA